MARPFLLAVVVAAAALLATPAAAAAPIMPKAPCLVIFDVDRTLTGAQGSGGGGSGTGQCRSDKSFGNIRDTAYLAKGPLTLSDLALKMASTKAGRNCYLGVITAGKMASGSAPDDEHKLIARQLSSDGGNAKTPAYKHMTWAHAKGSTPAPLLHSADPKAKFLAVPLIVKFYEQASGGAKIPDRAVTFFDDIDGNVAPWKGSGYNARQISCATRADDPITGQRYGIGECGATAAEVDAGWLKAGCSLCRGKAC